MNKYNSRKTKDACGVDRNSLLNDGEFMGDFILKSDADKVAAMLNEHAALVAVAEASAIYCESFFGHPTPNEKKLLKALAKLAAVRAGSEVAK